MKQENCSLKSNWILNSQAMMDRCLGFAPFHNGSFRHRGKGGHKLALGAEMCAQAHGVGGEAAQLTFGPQMPVEGAMLSKATATLVALERLLARVVADVAHQGALFPEALVAELADVGLLVKMGPEMDLLGVLREGGAGQ